MDFVIVTGDQAIFDTAFPPANVIAPPGVITGSSKAKATAPIVCVVGDESSVVVPAASYFTPSFPIPGVGTLTIISLGGDQKAKKGKSGGKQVILKGTKFQARLQVSVPATVPSVGGPVPDPNPMYSGTGSFVTTNTKVKMQ